MTKTLRNVFAVAMAIIIVLTSCIMMTETGFAATSTIKNYETKTIEHYTVKFDVKKISGAYYWAIKRFDENNVPMIDVYYSKTSDGAGKVIYTIDGTPADSDSPYQIPWSQVSVISNGTYAVISYKIDSQSRNVVVRIKLSDGTKTVVQNTVKYRDVKPFALYGGKVALAFYDPDMNVSEHQYKICVYSGKTKKKTVYDAEPIVDRSGNSKYAYYEKDVNGVDKAYVLNMDTLTTKFIANEVYRLDAGKTNCYYAVESSFNKYAYYKIPVAGGTKTKLRTLEHSPVAIIGNYGYFNASLEKGAPDVCYKVNLDTGVKTKMDTEKWRKEANPNLY